MGGVRGKRVRRRLSVEGRTSDVTVKFVERTLSATGLCTLYYCPPAWGGESIEKGEHSPTLKNDQIQKFVLLFSND